MSQFIKAIKLGEPLTASGAVEDINTLWEAVTSEQGVRPRLLNVWPVADGLLVLLFDWAQPTLLPMDQEMPAGGGSLMEKPLLGRDSRERVLRDAR